MLIISNDSFLIGLLTGYSVANNFFFRSVSSSKPLFVNNADRIFRVIIIDLRSLSPLLMKSHFESLKQVNAEYGITICAVHNQHDNAFNPSLSWVKHFKDVDLLTQLDSYITQFIIGTQNIYSERRNKNRRAVPDRRSLSAAYNLASNDHNSDYCNGAKLDDERFSLGQFEIDKNSQTVHRNGQNLALTGKEFKLFMLLADVREHVCSTEKIIEQLWPNTRRANKSDLYQYMHLLRKKVERDPDHPQWILTVKGVGYRLNTSEPAT